MKNKKVILVNGNGSKWYEQAIFIVNKNEANVPKNIVFEAEKIINEYLNKNYPDKKYPNNISNVYNNKLKNNVSSIKALEKKQPKKANRKVNMYLNLFIFFTISIIICLLYLILY